LTNSTINRSMEAFVYCWFDKKTKKRYIGYHKGTPEDGYVCSSKYFLSEYETRKEDFRRKILSFGSVEEMREEEIRLLKKYDAASNERFFNRNNGGYWIVFTDEVRQKMREKKLGAPPSNKGKKAPAHVYSEEMNKKRSEALKGRKKSPETVERMKKAQQQRDPSTRARGWSQSEEHRKIASENLNSKSECPHCGKVGKKGNMVRWHFENCPKIRDSKV